MTITRIGQDHWIERGMRIRRAREWLGPSQGELASCLQELLGRSYSRTAVSNIEAGGRKVSVDELRVLAYLLDQSEDWLDGKEGSAFNEAPDSTLCQVGVDFTWFRRPIDFTAAGSRLRVAA